MTTILILGGIGILTLLAELVLPGGLLGIVSALCLVGAVIATGSVVAIAGERPLDVVFDGVGKSVFDQSLSLLRTRGMMVTFGNASGPVDPVSPLVLSANGSLFLTRPTLFHYIRTNAELQSRADDLFGWVASGDLDVRIGARYALRDAAEAHRALEGRATTGKVLLVP